MVFGAFLKPRNIVILVAALIMAALLSDPTALPNLLGYGYAIPDAIAVSGGLAVYTAAALQTLSSKKYHEEFNRSEKQRSIRELNRKANRLAAEARRNTIILT